MKSLKFLLLLCLVFLLGGCASAKEISNSALTWKIDVSKHELKEGLHAVESVVQYDGSKMDVEHEQSPTEGAMYLILNIKISKIGDEPVPFDWKKLAVQDQAGNTYARHGNDTFLEQYNYIPRLTGLEIRFGENEGWLCFEIPAEAAKGKLTLIYSADGSQQEISLE
jgi:hypothetical protein